MQTSDTELAKLLRFAASDAERKQPAEHIRQGMSAEVLYELANLIAPRDAGFVFRLVPKSKLTPPKKAMPVKRRALRGQMIFSVGRRASASPKRVTLTEREKDRLLRLGAIWDLATKVWDDDESARAFLFRPHPMLDGQKPVDIALASAPGAERVRNILGRLLYGTAA